MRVSIEMNYTRDKANPDQEPLDAFIVGVLPDIQGAWARNAEGSGFIYDNEGSIVGRWTTKRSS